VGCAYGKGVSVSESGDEAQHGVPIVGGDAGIAGSLAYGRGEEGGHVAALDEGTDDYLLIETVHCQGCLRLATGS